MSSCLSFNLLEVECTQSMEFIADKYGFEEERDSTVGLLVDSSRKPQGASLVQGHYDSLKLNEEYLLTGYALAKPFSL